jgi:hypothetical protein
MTVILTAFTTFQFSGILRLNGNNFVGTIRDSFDGWFSLDFADIKNNEFEGPLPSSVFDIPSLRIFYASNNNFDSTIPENWANSPVLRDLYLNGNQLTGTVPAVEPGQLVGLTELILQENQLTGTVPPSVCQLRVEGSGLLVSLWTDCAVDANPRIECDSSCCNQCFPNATATDLGIQDPPF